MKQLSDGHLIWADGMLYPVLHKLEKEKLITAKWQVSEGKKMRKYYAITGEGKSVLETERQHWQFAHSLMSRVLNLENNV